MRAVVQRLFGRLAAVVSVLIIATALLSLAVRLALPATDLFRDRIGDALGRTLGAQVRIGQVDLRLRGFAPQFKLLDVRLRDRDGGTLLALRELRVDLDLSASVREGAPRIDGVTLIGAELEVARERDGTIRVRGLSAPGGDDPGALTFFLRRGRFSLADSTLTWIDRRAGVPAVHLRVERLDLQNLHHRHLLRVFARPAGEVHGNLTLLADLTGSPRRQGDLSGALYLRWQGRDLARLLRGRLPVGLGIESRRVDIESWVRLDAGQPIAARARAGLGGVQLRQPGDRGRLDLGDVRVLADWRPTDRGWRLRLARLALAGVELPSAALRRDRPPAPGAGAAAMPPRLSGRIAELPLTLLPRLAALLPDANTRQTLRRFDISGMARDLRFVLDQGPGGDLAADWEVQGAIDGLRLDQCTAETAATGTDAAAPDPCPGRHTRLAGLDAVFEAGPGGGYVGLDGPSARLDLTPILGGALELEPLAGDLQWRLDADGVLDLWTDALTADTPDIETRTRLRAQLYTFGASPILDLQSSMRNGRPGNYDRLATYLPASLMDDALKRWLLRAVRAGTVTSGAAAFHGRLRDFPNDCGNDHFELTLNLAGAEFDYWPPPQAPRRTRFEARPGAAADSGSRAEPSAADSAPTLGWPPLRALDGSLRFRDRALTIDVARGTLHETRLTSGSARIDNLWRPQTLHLSARGAGPMTDGLWALKNTPLASNLAGVADAFDATGDTTLELALQIPLQAPAAGAQPRPVGFDGALLFDGKPSLTPRALPLTLTGLDGRLVFDNAGVRAEGIAARIDEQRIRIGLRTEPSGAGQGSTRIEIAGRSAVADLSRRFASPLWSLADGNADWKAELKIANADLHLAAPPLHILLESDLRGLALSPPAPLGKSAEQTRTLRLATAFTGTWPMQLSLDYGTTSALVQLDRARDAPAPAPERIAVAFGRTADALPARRGILIGGQLDAVDLSDWLAWSREAGALFQAAPAAGADTGSGLDLLPSRLAIGRLRFGALRLRDLDVRFASRPGGWTIGFNGDGFDGGQGSGNKRGAGASGGSVDLPAFGSGGTLRVRLDDLNLAPFIAPGQDARQPRTDADPHDLGHLELTVESLRIGDDLLGRALLRTEPTAGGVRFDEVSIDGPLLRARSSGDWTVDATGYAQTELRATAHTEDFGQLLRVLDYYSDIEGAPADAQLTLNWPGGPQRFALDLARGSLDMQFGAGRLLAVDPGVGRMLGLVNLSALTRRLALDFSDVTDPGFGFDSIRGRVDIGNGRARIDRFELLSSTADIRITGDADLVRRTLDQTVQVTPKVGSGVAIAGAVAGGPLVGAAVLLADKVSGGAMDRIGRQDYRVTGPWADPKIERLPMLSGGTALRSEAGGDTAPRSDPRPTLSSRPRATGKGFGTERGEDGRPGNRRAEPKADNPFLEGF